MKRYLWLLAIMSVAPLLGCSQSDPSAASLAASGEKEDGATAPTGASTAAGGDATGAAALEPLQTVTPNEAVTEFLNALCQGDEDKADRLFTDKAREETTKHDLAVKPPGSATAQFTVGEVEYLGEGTGAHVGSTWSDINPEGVRQTHDIVWILRHNDAGWRIAGMATRLPGDDQPLVLNFEDPEDLVHQQQLAEERMARREEQATRQAQQGQDAPDATIPR